MPKCVRVGPMVQVTNKVIVAMVRVVILGWPGRMYRIIGWEFESLHILYIFHINAKGYLKPITMR